MIFKSFENLLSGKRTMSLISDMTLFIRRTFTANEDITIPADQVLQMHSPKIDGELVTDGEVYIL